MDEIFSPTNWHDLYYDADYEKARDRFIPEALKTARKGRGDKNPFVDEKRREGWTASFNRAYHSAMNRLSRGLL